MARAFRAGGLRVGVQRFAVPGRGRSRNVIGVLDTPRTCLRIVMAHTDSAPGAPGANDNASGLGVLAALAGRLRRLGPGCDVWLVATGAEERLYTGSPDHLGALALARRARARGGRKRLRFALSLDEVGRDRPFWLRSPARLAAGSGGGRAAASGPPCARAGQLGARRGHRQLRSPRVRAAGPARREARGGRRAASPAATCPATAPAGSTRAPCGWREGSPKQPSWPARRLRAQSARLPGR